MKEKKDRALPYPAFPGGDWKLEVKKFDFRFCPPGYLCNVWENGGFLCYEMYLPADTSKKKQERGAGHKPVSTREMNRWKEVLARFFMDTLVGLQHSDGRSKVNVFFSNLIKENIEFKRNGKSVMLRKMPDDPACIRISAGGNIGGTVYLTFRGELADVHAVLLELLDITAEQLRQKGTKFITGKLTTNK